MAGKKGSRVDRALKYILRIKTNFDFAVDAGGGASKEAKLE
jgi:hypothetical protein